jgi:hypothetical protein
MNVSKLTQLRTKTNSELTAVIRRRLDAGRDHARRGSYMQAEKAYQEARRLLPVVDNLSHGERQQLESKLARLGEMLEERTAKTSVQTAACL